MTTMLCCNSSCAYKKSNELFFDKVIKTLKMEVLDCIENNITFAIHEGKIVIDTKHKWDCLRKMVSAIWFKENVKLDLNESEIKKFRKIPKI